MSSDVAKALRRRQQRWREWLADISRVLARGQKIPVGPISLNRARRREDPGATATVLLCSPHPDDEALVGALPLRMRLESAARVVNCAVTLGHNRKERARRTQELRASCGCLGFAVVVANEPSGLEDVDIEFRKRQPRQWAAKVRALAEILNRENPRFVFVPHADDCHPAHVGTHYLAIDALRRYQQKSDRNILLIETEYWRELPEPNLMVGVTPELEARLLLAISQHGGEVRRNPYHLEHPARMMDNARRGSELVGGWGQATCGYCYAELYRVSVMREGRVVRPRSNRFLRLEPSEQVAADEVASYFQP